MWERLWIQIIINNSSSSMSCLVASLSSFLTRKDMESSGRRCSHTLWQTSIRFWGRGREGSGAVRCNMRSDLTPPHNSASIKEQTRASACGPPGFIFRSGVGGTNEAKRKFVRISLIVFFLLILSRREGRIAFKIVHMHARGPKAFPRPTFPKTTTKTSWPCHFDTGKSR